MYCVNAAETHETFRQESGMRYHLLHHNILWFLRRASHSIL